MMTRPLIAGLLILTAVVAESQAAVDLVTIPRREGTQLTIYNSEDITMVREHRLLTVKQGVNRIQFSWANTLIDPTSIDFRILDHQDKVDLIDTTFPAGRNDALQWNIQSRMAGKSRPMISAVHINVLAASSHSAVETMTSIVR